MSLPEHKVNVGFRESEMVMPADQADADAPPAVERQPLPAKPPHGEGIGAPLAEIRARLIAIIDSVDDILKEHAAPLLAEARRQLGACACRIAVIGEVKVGKSTLINALAARPGLLPTRFNPWSAVVCALHFRNAAEAPEHAAVFHLFAADEWQRLAEGGGGLYEPSGRPISGFAPELLRTQLGLMRQRAERRLGSRFQTLLGQCHRFAALTPQLIAEYVGAGDDGAAAAPGARQLYSEITRAADFYFGDGPFAFPATLIDTPGTNDPFLVGDEVTRRSLEDADIHLVVVSALRPLSVSDLAVLRLLKKMHKDRLIVFINRSDQLANPEAARRVKAAVEARLSAELPALRIPVICGSAWLAGRLLEPQAAACAAAEAAPPSPPDGSRGLLSAGSGMGELSAAISKTMCASGVAVLLRQIAACLAEWLHSAERADRAEVGAIEEARATRRKNAEAARARVAEEQRALTLFEERADALRKSFREVGDHLHDIVKLGSNMLRTQLRDTVRDFSDAQADALLRALPRRKAWQAWQCDAEPLREQVEDRYLRAIARIEAEFARVEQFLYPHLKVIVAGLLPDYDPELLAAPVWPLDKGPSTAALSRLGSMDLEAGWLRRLLSARRTLLDRANHVRRHIQQEFFPLVEDLIEDAEQHLKLRVDYTLERANAIVAGLRMGIERRRASLASEFAQLNGAGDSDANEQLARAQYDRTAICIARRAASTSALEQLTALLERLDALQRA
jgi:hypothetical protein